MSLPETLPPLPGLPHVVPRSGVPVAATQALRRLLERDAQWRANAFERDTPVAYLLRRRAMLVDRVVRHVFAATVGLRPNVALFAVGGFGRGELFPHSDVDLLALVDKRPTANTQRALQRFFTCLWDVGLNPGQAVRDPTQCRVMARDDVTVFTSLMDGRHLAGDPLMSAVLAQVRSDPGIWPADRYLAAKLEDRRVRHARFGDTARSLEPNLKDGPGGLRTLDVLRWLGRRVMGLPTLDMMASRDVLDASETGQLLDAEATLQRYRFALHLEAGRAEERLLFDYQRALAARMGFDDGGTANAGVEQFMQAYYRAASVIERMGAQVAERFAEALEPAPSLQPVNADFVQRGKRLASVDPQLFLRRPAALVEAFAVRMEHPDIIGFSAATIRQIRHAVAGLGDRMATDDGVMRAFLGILRRGAPASRALWRMNRFGMLAAIVPPFARVVGRMQYDLFHAYTVDEHTVRVLLNVARFADDDARRDFPLGCELFAGIAQPELLLLAALFHDIAKGRGGDHSVLGETDARQFCTRLGLGNDDIDTVAWLVRWHLLMSETAQRQDITDPAVVHRFAERVGDWETLDYLYLLTVADIIGTRPNLWNAWKDRLLTDLYVAARYVLRADPALPSRTETRVRACRERALTLLQADHVEVDQVASVWSDFPDASFLRHRPEQIAWQTRAILKSEGQRPLVEIHPFSVRGATEVFVYAEDRDSLFADITAALDHQRFSVVEARILSSTTGMALDTFLVLDSQTQKPASLERVEVLHRRLRKALAPEAHVRPAHRTLSRQLRHFQMRPQVSFATDIDKQLTQVALVSSDRPGLLASIARAFLEAGVRVVDARIATFGERVEDFFLVGGPDGLLDEAACEALHAILEHHVAGDADDPA